MPEELQTGVSVTQHWHSRSLTQPEEPPHLPIPHVGALPARQVEAECAVEEETVVNAARTSLNFHLTTCLKKRGLRVLEAPPKMAACVYCTSETELDEGGVPVCPSCSEARIKRKPPATEQDIRRTLLQDVFELTARTNEATAEFDAVMGQVPSGLPHPDGTQRIKNASSKLTIARKEPMKAHRRLDEYFRHEIDLKRSG